MRLVFTTFVKLLLLLVVLGIDAGLLPGMGGNWNVLNTAFIVSIFFVFVFRNTIAFTFYFASTLLIAFTAGNLFLIPLVAGFISLFAINLLLERFFTNRSYYVLLALGIIAWSLYHILYGIMLFLYQFVVPDKIIQPITTEWFFTVVSSLLFVLLLLTIGYLAMNFMSKRFKSYFIISDY